MLCYDHLSNRMKHAEVLKAMARGSMVGKHTVDGRYFQIVFGHFNDFVSSFGVQRLKVISLVGAKLVDFGRSLLFTELSD